MIKTTKKEEQHVKKSHAYYATDASSCERQGQGQSSYLPALADASDCDTSSTSCSECMEVKKTSSSSPAASSSSHTIRATTGGIASSSLPQHNQSRSKGNQVQNHDKLTDNRRLNAFCPGLFFCDFFSWEEDEELPYELDECPPRNTGTKAVKVSRNDCQKDEEVSNDNHVQELIEMDIMELLGCTSVSPWQANSLEIDDLSHLCNKCNWMPCELETQETHIMKIKSGTVTSMKGQMHEQKTLRNRSALMKQKARERIQILRKSGLSRNFSLKEVSCLSNRTQKRGEFTRSNVVSIGKSKTVDWSSLQKWKQERCQFETSSESRCLTYPRRVNDNVYKANVLTNDTVTSRTVYVEFADSTSTESDVELFYDSDPGPEIAFGKASISEHDGSISCTMPLCDSLLQTYDIHSFDLNNNNAITQLVSELMHGTYTFIWHPNNNIPMKTCHPLIVKCWFEMGSCLITKLVNPKFFWKNISPSQPHSKASSGNTYVSPQHIDLLDIVRIFTPTNIKRDTYPFAKQQSSFLISTNESKEFLFEAKSTDERNRFLFVMKLMVARLASKIIVGDSDVFSEFFDLMPS
mmetsp:Transcript_4818/g.9188  ORF Transcript_4818/g.9188 Transcript_4818/m.9188 type:complete len:579 (+) Transcript_4818:449-2185(+)